MSSASGSVSSLRSSVLIRVWLSALVALLPLGTPLGALAADDDAWYARVVQRDPDKDAKADAELKAAADRAEAEAKARAQAIAAARAEVDALITAQAVAKAAAAGEALAKVAADTEAKLESNAQAAQAAEAEQAAEAAEDGPILVAMNTPSEPAPEIAPTEAPENEASITAEAIIEAQPSAAPGEVTVADLSSGGSLTTFWFGDDPEAFGSDVFGSLASNEPLSEFSTGSFGLGEGRTDALASSGGDLENLRFGSLMQAEGPALLAIRGAGQESDASRLQAGAQTFVEDIFGGQQGGSLFGRDDRERTRTPATRASQPVAGRPQAEWGAATTITVGNRSTLKSDTTVNVPINIGPLKERVFGQFSLQTGREDGFIKNVTDGDRVGDQRLLGGRAALLFRPTENSELNIVWDRTDQDSTLSPGRCQDVDSLSPNRLLLNSAFRFGERCNARVKGDVDKVFSDSIRDNDNDNEGVSVNLDVSLGDSWMASSISSWREISQNLGEGDFDGTDALVTLAEKAKNGREVLSQEFRLSGGLFDDRLRLVTGVQYLDDREEQSGGFNRLEGSSDFMDLVSLTGDDRAMLRLTPGRDSQELMRRGFDVMALQRPTAIRDSEGLLITTGRIRGVNVFENIDAFARATGTADEDGRAGANTFRSLTESFRGGLAAVDDSSGFSDDDNTKTYATYLESGFDVTDRFTLGAKLKYSLEMRDRTTTTTPKNAIDADGNLISFTNRDQDARVNNLAPSADFTYQLANGFIVNGGYERSFARGVIDREQPEVFDTYVFGLNTRWLDDKLRVNLQGYYSVYDDIQVDLRISEELGQNSVRRLNSAKGVIQGLDFDFVSSWKTRIGGFDLGGRLGLVNAEYDRFETNVQRPVGTPICTSGPECKITAAALVDQEFVRLREGAMIPQDVMNIPDADIVERGVIQLPVAVGPAATSLEAADMASQSELVDRAGELKFQNTPSVSYNLFLRYQLPMNRFGDLSAQTSWTGQNRTAQNFFNTVEQGSYGVLDFNLSWEHPSRKFTIGAFMSNALDRRFIESATNSSDFDGAESIFFSRPRTYGIQFGYRFGSLASR